jgi:hypothetical protein
MAPPLAAVPEVLLPLLAAATVGVRVHFVGVRMTLAREPLLALCARGRLLGLRAGPLRLGRLDLGALPQLLGLHPLAGPSLVATLFRAEQQHGQYRDRRDGDDDQQDRSHRMVTSSVIKRVPMRVGG